VKAPGAGWPGRILPSLVAAAGVYAVGVALTYILQAQNTEAWLLPLAAGAATLVLGICVMFEPTAPMPPLPQIGSRVLAMAMLVVYAFVLLPYLGFLPGSLLLALGVTGCFATRRWLVGAGALLLVVAIWALFAYGLAEPLPGGLL
jgi:hypothetical protein